jgi:protein-tyrosine phosphatase
VTPNLRDLGGLPTRDGRTTRVGAVMRGGAPAPADWEALRASGVRTVVDLRNDDERSAVATPLGMAVVHVPLDGVDEDPAFWEVWGTGPQFGTPLYYRPHLDRFPERSVRAVAAVADAPPGGVLVHCVGGRDRTGQIAMLLLALVGVAPEAIAADYELSGPPDDDVRAFLAERGTTAGELIVETLAGLDVEAHLRAAGLTDEQLVRLDERLVA